MRFAEIVDGTVGAVFVAEPDVAAANGWVGPLPDQVGPGWTYDGSYFRPPPAPPEPEPEASPAELVAGLLRVFASSQQVEGAPPWAQPAGAHDGYLPGAIVEHAGSSWRNDLAVMNVWEPGVQGGGWVNLAAPPPGSIPDWVQPGGAHDAYQVGDRVRHNGQVWVSTAAGNVWEPGVFGWEPVAS